MEKRSIARKTRSDKKRAINPFVDSQTLEQLCQLAYVCDRPLKDIGESLCQHGCQTSSLIEDLAHLFRRDYWFKEQTLFRGNPKMPPIHRKWTADKNRINLRLPQVTHEIISQLSFSMDSSVSLTTTILIEKALAESSILGQILVRYLREDLDANRMKELYRLIRYVSRSENPHEHVDVGGFVTYLMDVMGGRAQRIRDVVTLWIEQFSR